MSENYVKKSLFYKKIAIYDIKDHTNGSDSILTKQSSCKIHICTLLGIMPINAAIAEPQNEKIDIDRTFSKATEECSYNRSFI